MKKLNKKSFYVELSKLQAFFPYVWVCCYFSKWHPIESNNKKEKLIKQSVYTNWAQTLLIISVKYALIIFRSSQADVYHKLAHPSHLRCEVIK